MLLNNKIHIPAVDRFEEIYSQSAIDICCILEKFTISVISSDTYLKMSEAGPDLIQSPFSECINKKGHDASSTEAYIIINQSYCDSLNLTEEEMMAAIAHEIGHIIFFFLENKEIYSKSCEEVKADGYAKIMGLEDPLKSVLHKMKNSDLFSQEQKNVIESRLRFLEI